MVVGLACTHVPATAGDRVGVTAPRATADEKVMLMSALVGAVVVPEAGEVPRTTRGVATVWWCLVVFPLFAPGEPGEVDFPMPYATAAATTTRRTPPPMKRNVRPRRGGLPCAS